MERLKWFVVFIAAAGGGFALAGFWGFVLAPCAVCGFLLWRHQRLAEASGTEDERLAQFIAAKTPDKKP